jgi:exosortase A
VKYDLAAARTAPVAQRPTWTRALLLYAAFSIGMLLLFVDVVRSMATTWWLTTAFNHCALVPVASVFLIWRERESLLQKTPRCDLLGIALLSAALLGWLVSRAAEVMLFQQLALVAVFIALFVAIFGRRIARDVAFPLGFLFLMVPFGEGLLPLLQDFTAHFAVRILRLLNIPVFHDGVLITTPSGLFEVAEACAGLRFLIANIVIALLFSHLAYRRSWKWFLFISLAIAVPILANALRATIIIYIAYLTDNEYAVGVDHIVYGWVFFALVMFLLLLIGNSFADIPQSADQTRTAYIHPTPLSKVSTYVPFLALILLIAAPAYAAVIMRLPSDVPTLSTPTLDLRGSWERTSPGDWRPVFNGADLMLGSGYAESGDQVDVFIGYYAFQRPGAELLQGKNRLADGERWYRRRAGEYPLDLAGLPATVRVEELMTADQQHRVVFSWYWVGGRFTASRGEALALQALDRLLGRSRPAAVLVAAAPYETTPNEAVNVLERFLREHPRLESYLESIEMAVAPATMS